MASTNQIVGIGKNNSTLTENQCLALLTDVTITFESCSDEDLDSLYFVAKKRWAYHSTRQNLINTLNQFRLDNSIV